MSNTASPQNARVAELGELLRRHEDAIATSKGYVDLSIVDASLKRQAANVVAKATNLDAEGERYINAFRLISEKGLEAFSGEDGRALREIAPRDSEAYTTIMVVHRHAFGEGMLPNWGTMQPVLQGMKSAAEDIAQRRPEDHPACNLEGLGELKPDSVSCVGKSSASISRK